MFSPPWLRLYRRQRGWTNQRVMSQLSAGCTTAIDAVPVAFLVTIMDYVDIATRVKTSHPDVFAELRESIRTNGYVGEPVIIGFDDSGIALIRGAHNTYAAWLEGLHCVPARCVRFSEWSPEQGPSITRHEWPVRRALGDECSPSELGVPTAK